VSSRGELIWGSLELGIKGHSLHWQVDVHGLSSYYSFLQELQEIKDRSLELFGGKEEKRGKDL
jgi:hypothetical protein